MFVYIVFSTYINCFLVRRRITEWNILHVTFLLQFMIINKYIAFHKNIKMNMKEFLKAINCRKYVNENTYQWNFK